MKQVRTPHVADTDTARWKLKLLEDTCLPHISGCDDIVASENSHTYIELWNTQKGLQGSSSKRIKQQPSPPRKLHAYLQS
ncbi:uncharacterized protein LOC144820423 isoform X5 [Lissotriton helveticus]